MYILNLNAWILVKKNKYNLQIVSKNIIPILWKSVHIRLMVYTVSRNLVAELPLVRLLRLQRLFSRGFLCRGIASARGLWDYANTGALEGGWYLFGLQLASSRSTSFFLFSSYENGEKKTSERISTNIYKVVTDLPCKKDFTLCNI